MNKVPDYTTWTALSLAVEPKVACFQPRITRSNGSNSKGCPQNILMNKLIVRIASQGSDGNTKPQWRCVGEECDHIRSGNPQEARVLKHACVCNRLPSGLRQEAIEASKDGSLMEQIFEARQDGTDNFHSPLDHTIPLKRKASQPTLDITPFRQAGKKKDEES